jgi:leucine dehydrogenase
VLDDDTIPRLKAKVVAGGANNQLRDEGRHAAALAARDIFYAPDFVLNIGGVIAAAQEVDSFDEGADADALFAAACERARVIPEILDEVVQLAREQELTTHAAAVRLAKLRIDDARA